LSAGKKESLRMQWPWSKKTKHQIPSLNLIFDLRFPIFNFFRIANWQSAIENYRICSGHKA
jgi:hypothetical protein